MADRELQNTAKDLQESTARTSLHPLFYEEQHGKSFTRANSLRPMHPSVRRYLALSVVFEFSMGIMAYIGALHSIFDPEDPLASYGWAIFGACFIIMGLITSAMLSLDLLTGRILGVLDRPTLRSRLQRQKRAYRYVARPTHLRGMTIGAVFFAVLCFFGLCVQGLIALGLLRLPK